jgi:hypothetical protein
VLHISQLLSLDNFVLQLKLYFAAAAARVAEQPASPHNWLAVAKASQIQHSAMCICAPGRPVISRGRLLAQPWQTGTACILTFILGHSLVCAGARHCCHSYL